MRVMGASSEAEMVACFLLGELSSERFGDAIRSGLVADGLPESLLTHPDLGDAEANAARRALLAATRGYGENRDLFEGFPADVAWTWAEITAAEIATVRYVDYSYWVELSGGSRLPTDAARRIRAGKHAFDVPNEPFVTTARAIAASGRFPPLILVGVRHDELVCLEGHLRLTAYALAGFAAGVECLVGTAPDMARWAR
ncbi:hypothetical protein GFY24_10690 [Nocardia sp. SYP-A9097]|uniref:hypothetical protein n=1 Tax=Nocardia sp. SYP-A9097 TaxID=2663237 RepID=UPI00129AC962|nr:hypothetical protein [Nocardia sp. SYP-A9097]MRH87907.1 hypothetical protein [Nocardia sp. SYP-A9097]